MKHLKRFCFFTAFLLLLVSCKKEKEETPNNPTTTGENSTDSETMSIIVPNGEEQYLNIESDYIFDQTQLHTFELDIPEASYEFLDNNPAAEKYVEGSLTFEEETISPVGIRYKGSIGGFIGCVSGNNWANPSGSKTCTKLSMKIKINWEGREERFYGLKKLQFHSMNADDSQMRDRLGYWLFAQMGVPSPRAVHARLIINGEFVGLFSLVEQIDGRFARHNFDDGTGNLYKEIWPLQKNGTAFPTYKYLESLKTNEDESPTANIILGCAQEVVVASDSELKTVLNKWMDMNEILSYSVVDRTIRHDDGPFHWYCGGNNCDPHNFYWYENPTTQKLHLIPWDLDNAFENIINDANPVTPIADAWGETSNNCQPFNTSLFGIKQWSAACDKLTGGWTTFEEEYQALKAEFINGPLSVAEANTMIDLWAAQIQEATLEAKETHNDAISVAQWENAVNQLKLQLAYAREN